MKLGVNVGLIDRVLRVSIGIVLVVLAALGIVGPWGWIGLVPLVTGWLGRCPAYALFGWSTCPVKPRTDH